MATALAFPDAKRGRGNTDNAKSVLNTDISSAYLKHARFVLRHCLDKAEALASYARQSKDDTLRKMADRIQARAIRRCGELLRQVEASKGGQPTHKSTQEGTLLSIPTRESVAKDAGLSERQKVTALRVASIPQRRARIEGLLSCGCWLGVPPKVRNPHSYPP